MIITFTTSALFYEFFLAVMFGESTLPLGPGQMGNVSVWQPNTVKHCLVTKHFTVWQTCLVLFDRVRSCLIKFKSHQTFEQKLIGKTFLLI